MKLRIITMGIWKLVQTTPLANYLNIINIFYPNKNCLKMDFIWILSYLLVTLTFLWILKLNWITLLSLLRGNKLAKNKKLIHTKTFDIDKRHLCLTRTINLCCKQIISTSIFQSAIERNMFDIIHLVTCRKSWITYLMECCLCTNSQYNGKSEYSMNLRTNTHRNILKRSSRHNWFHLVKLLQFLLSLLSALFIRSFFKFLLSHGWYPMIIYDVRLYDICNYIYKHM